MNEKIPTNKILALISGIISCMLGFIVCMFVFSVLIMLMAAKLVLKSRDVPKLLGQSECPKQ